MGLQLTYAQYRGIIAERGRSGSGGENDMVEQITFQGVFEPTAGNGFSVYFPDLPGCASYGDTLSEAQKNAQDALGLHLYGMEKDGDPIPAPSAIPEIDPETAPGYLVCSVTVSPSLTRNEPDNWREHIGMKIISVSELGANTDRYIEIAQMQDVFITQNGKIVVKLTAYTE